MTHQLIESDLEGMSPEAIVKAMDDGRCMKILGSSDADIAAHEAIQGDGPLSDADVEALAAAGRHDEIVKAQLAGRIATSNDSK